MPGSTAKMKPLRCWEAAQKIACGYVGLLWRGVAERRRRGSLDLGIYPSLQIYDRRGRHAGAAIACDKNIFQECDVVEVGVSAREFSPEMALPVNENDPTGGDVTAILFCNVIFRKSNDEAGSMGLGGVSARESSPEGALPVNENVSYGGQGLHGARGIGAGVFAGGALPVNENVPQGDDVWNFLVTWTVSVAGRGSTVVTFIISGGRAQFISGGFH